MRNNNIIVLPAALLVLVVCLLTGGCTRNNGNIGRQFGQWKLTSAETGGKTDAAYGGNVFWSFQNTTVEMKRVEASHVTESTFGNYRIDGGTLTITFPDEERPPLSGLNLQRVNEMQILRLTHSEMMLAYTPSGTGDCTVLRFVKW